MTDEMRIEAQLDARDRYFNEYDQYHFDEVSRTYFIWIDTKDTTKAEEIVKETAEIHTAPEVNPPYRPGQLRVIAGLFFHWSKSICVCIFLALYFSTLILLSHQS